MTVEGRVPSAGKWKPEIASLNKGSMNSGPFPMLKRCREFVFSDPIIALVRKAP